MWKEVVAAQDKIPKRIKDVDLHSRKASANAYKNGAWATANGFGSLVNPFKAKGSKSINVSRRSTAR
jgi:hypothetical protein